MPNFVVAIICRRQLGLLFLQRMRRENLQALASEKLGNLQRRLVLRPLSPDNRCILCCLVKIYFLIFPAPIDKAKTAKEEARELLLKEEASVRMKVGQVQKNLSLMLDALGELAIANPIFTHGQLPSLVSNLFLPSVVSFSFYC
jgi:hypothetical protein